MFYNKTINKYLTTHRPPQYLKDSKLKNYNNAPNLIELVVNVSFEREIYDL